MDPSDLAAAWIALTNKAAETGEITLAPLTVTNDVGPLHAGRDGMGRLHLLVPVRAGTPVRPDRRSRGVTIDRTELVVSGARQLFIDVVCHERPLNDVFQRLAAEMVQRMVGEPTASVAVCQQVLARWRELLERRRGSLGLEGLVGLFGELHTLERIVGNDPSRRIELWTGPTGSKHDLTTSSTEVEVKTSTRREGRFVEIHGVEQLQPTDGRALFLIFIRAEENQDGRTIGDIISSLKTLGVDSAYLDQLVSRTGWEATAEEDRLTVIEERAYAIDANFPRIVPSTFAAGGVPGGVLRLRYEVDLTGPAPVPLRDESLEGLLQELALHE